mmetsp:Transcript_5949/g.13851  ORF Transcript_5949/g.13851 Transcript_5949/m.13851 type:complete len:214 (+) Transcript_5949:4795-5436(+)
MAEGYCAAVSLFSQSSLPVMGWTAIITVSSPVAPAGPCTKIRGSAPAGVIVCPRSVSLVKSALWSSDHTGLPSSSTSSPISSKPPSLSASIKGGGDTNRPPLLAPIAGGDSKSESSGVNHATVRFQCSPPVPASTALTVYSSRCMSIGGLSSPPSASGACEWCPVVMSRTHFTLPVVTSSAKNLVLLEPATMPHVSSSSGQSLIGSSDSSVMR